MALPKAYLCTVVYCTAVTEHLKISLELRCLDKEKPIFIAMGREEKLCMHKVNTRIGYIGGNSLSLLSIKSHQGRSNSVLIPTMGILPRNFAFSHFRSK